MTERKRRQNLAKCCSVSLQSWMTESMKLLRSERTSTSFAKKSSNYWLEMWYMFDFSWKIVVTIVQSELNLHDLTVVDAGVEMKLNKFVILSHNGDIMCLFDRTEDRINIFTWTMISVQLTEARLRKWGTLEFASSFFEGKPQNAVVLSLEVADGIVKTTLKHPRKRFNLFYMASDLYLNIWSRWKTEPQRVQVKQC